MNDLTELDFLKARQLAFQYVVKYFSINHKEPLPDTGKDVAEIWHVELEISTPQGLECICVSLVLLPDFPLSLPKIYIANDWLSKLSYPLNINMSGNVCTFDTVTSIPNPSLPGQVIEECLRQAKRIIEAAFKNKKAEQYDEEFRAYWEGSYHQHDLVSKSCLSLIDETGEIPTQITFAFLSKPFGEFDSAIYSNLQSIHIFKQNLLKHGIKFSPIPTFFIGLINSFPPPYRLTNELVCKILQDADRMSEFEEYLSQSKSNSIIITFAKRIDERLLIFGWKHTTATPHNGRKRKRRKTVHKLTPSKRIKCFSEGKALNTIQRFSPQTFGNERQIYRSARDYACVDTKWDPLVSISGLGSVGSNLIPLLESANINRFILIDPDRLFVENLGRHLLGLRDVGKNKVNAMADYLEERNPLTDVTTYTAKISDLLIDTPLILADCGFNFFCTGDTNVENWLMSSIAAQKVSIGRAFFLWVEPYLAGGHCFYLSDNHKLKPTAYFDNHNFIYNIIDSSEHINGRFVKREAGCQTTYIPYDGSLMKMFLGATFPYILDIMRSDSGQSQCISWAGNIEAVQRMGIATSERAKSLQSYTVTVTNL